MIVVTGATGHVGAELPLVAVLRRSASDPKPKYTTDRYLVVQSNVGTIGIPRGVKERTFIAALAL